MLWLRSSKQATIYTYYRPKKNNGLQMLLKQSGGFTDIFPLLWGNRVSFVNLQRLSISFVNLQILRESKLSKDNYDWKFQLLMDSANQPQDRNIWRGTHQKSFKKMTWATQSVDFIYYVNLQETKSLESHQHHQGQVSNHQIWLGHNDFSLNYKGLHLTIMQPSWK